MLANVTPSLDAGAAEVPSSKVSWAGLFAFPFVITRPTATGLPTSTTEGDAVRFGTRSVRTEIDCDTEEVSMTPFTVRVTVSVTV